MDTNSLTAQQIDDLFRFLPLFDKPGPGFVETWRGGEGTQEGAIAMPYPEYLPDVEDFFCLAGQAWWSHSDHEPAQAAAMLEDEGATRLATIAQIRTMLTSCVRGERSATDIETPSYGPGALWRSSGASESCAVRSSEHVISQVWRTAIGSDSEIRLEA